MASPYGRKSMLSLNNWPGSAGGNGVRKERSSSTASRDFWSRVSQQMSFIDGSTRSNSILSTSSGGQAPPPAPAAPPASPSRTTQTGGGSIYENYFHYADDDDEDDEEGAMELRPLSRATSVAAETASVGGARGSMPSAGGAAHSILRHHRQSERHHPSVPRKASSWEESSALQRRRSVLLLTAAAGPGSCPGVAAALLANNSEQLDKRDLRYYFQHPYPRLFITYFVIFCNFLLFAEDPISHSHTESDIPMVGNVFSFVLTKYPPEWRWSLIKVLMWLLAILCGMIAGKLLIHGYLCGKLLRLKMFRDDQGSWMTMFLTVIVSLYVFSHLYNLLLKLWYDNWQLHINSQMGVTNASVMKAAACGTWLGDLITALMVTDMMLQDNLYPEWAPRARALWRRSNVPRILLFWVGSVVATAVVVTLIVSDWISWDHLNRDFLATTELSRAFLASFILVMDLLIVMQDWDFPHFTTTLHVNLPGFSVATLQWKYAEVDVTGKWFNYGIIFLVMLLDLNMWKNQIFYDPRDFGQYTGPDDKVRSLNETELLAAGNSSYWTWELRSQINPQTGMPFYEDDMQMNSRWMNYPLSIKCLAFIPSGIGLILFVSLISLYGRFPSNQDPVVAMFRSLTTIRQGFTLQGIGVHDWLPGKDNYNNLNDGDEECDKQIGQDEMLAI